MLIGTDGRPGFRNSSAGCWMETAFLLRNDLLLLYEEFRDGAPVALNGGPSVSSFLARVQEMVIRESSIVAVHRYAIARYRFYIYTAIASTR